MTDEIKTAETPKVDHRKMREIRYGDSLPTPSVTPYQSEFAYALAELSANSVAYVVRMGIDTLIQAMPDSMLQEVLANCDPTFAEQIRAVKSRSFDEITAANRINVSRRARRR